MNGADDAWTFSIDKHLPGKLLDAVLSLFRPIVHFITDVSGASWLGGAVIFSIFFSILLIRSGGRAGVGGAAAMHFYATWGFLGSLAFLVLLTLEWVFMPVLAILVTAIGNSLTGSEPGILQLLVLVAQSSDARSAFLQDVAAFYGGGHSVLPLGFRFAGMIAVAFGTMWIVAKGMVRIRA